MTRENAIKELISVIPIGRSQIERNQIGRSQTDRYIEHLIKIINHEPTLEEIKKEWEELGYTWEEHEIYICISIEDPIDGTLKNIYIDKKRKYYECYDEDDWDSRSLQLTFKEHQLLTKTFRALGWEV